MTLVGGVRSDRPVRDDLGGPVKSFACGDVVPGCQARFVGADDDEIMVSVARHAAQAHGMAEVPASVAQSVRDHIVLLV